MPETPRTVRELKAIHPADARTLRHLRALAMAELTALCRGPSHPVDRAVARRATRARHRETALIRLLKAAGVSVPALAFAFAALFPAAPTPIDSSLLPTLPSGDLPGVHGRTPTLTRPGVRDDAWTGFLFTT